MFEAAAIFQVCPACGYQCADPGVDCGCPLGATVEYKESGQVDVPTSVLYAIALARGQRKSLDVFDALFEIVQRQAEVYGAFRRAVAAGIRDDDEARRRALIDAASGAMELVHLAVDLAESLQPRPDRGDQP